MIVGELWKLLDDEAVARLDDAAMRLLTRSGVRVENDRLVGLLKAEGCTVDGATQRCRLTEPLIRKALAHVGGRADMQVAIPSGWSSTTRGSMFHAGSHPHLLEWPSGERRLATRDDIVAMARMAHVLDEFDSVGRVLTPADVDPRVEPLWTTLAIARTTTKRVGGGEVYFADSIKPLVRMGEVLTGHAGDTSLVPSCDFFATPLVLERDQAACFVEKRLLGLSCDPGTMPVAGLSSPVTPAGTVALAMAELIAGWVLGYLVNSDARAGGIVATGSLDLRTATACFASPEALLQNVATANAVRRLYGIQVIPITNYTDCKRPGLEAAFQKMMALLTVPFSQNRGIGAEGLLSAGQDYSPVQHMLDTEMNGAVRRYWGHFDVDDETLATDLTAAMLAAPTTNFLDTDHTRLHHAASLWRTRWFDRAPWLGAEQELRSEHDMLARIDAYCQDAIRRYEAPEVDAAKIRELERILAAAE